MDISICHPRSYAVYLIQNHIFQRILIIFAPEEAKIFKDYFIILA
jgi:hypothetical protein